MSTTVVNEEFNVETRKLIREQRATGNIFTKPSQILRWAAEHSDTIKQIGGDFTDGKCGFCARGIIKQYIMPDGNMEKICEYDNVEEIDFLKKAKEQSLAKEFPDGFQYVKSVTGIMAEMNNGERVYEHGESFYKNMKSFNEIASWLENYGF